jgi:tripartite-type tricarboxylate transporter receptor subunit TctC
MGVAFHPTYGDFMRIASILVAACLLAAAPLARAQADYPNKPIRLVVGFAAGGISDVLGRALAARLSANVGQSVLVENRAGAGTTIAADFIAKSPPDGYTLFLQDITSHAINASLYPKLPYDSVKDFTPIALVASTPLMLVVHPSTSARTVKELVAMLKAAPGKYSYGSSGNGTILHLASELFATSQGVTVTHIPYKGSAPATQAIMANDVSFVFSTMPPAVSAVKGGKLRALAVTTPARVGAAPEVPTMIEAGLPGYEVVLYSGILGPRGMDAALVKKINGEFARVVASPEMKKIYETLGADGITATSEDFGRMISREIGALAPLVKASGAKVD